MLTFLYFKDYQNIAGDDIKALQFTEESKNAIYSDTKRFGAYVNAEFDSLDGQPIMELTNQSDGVKQYVTIGSYVAYTPETEFIVIDKDVFEENMTLKVLN